MEPDMTPTPDSLTPVQRDAISGSNRDEDEYRDMVRRDDEQTSRAYKFNFRELLNKLYRKQGSNPATEFSDSVEEAVGEFAEPIYDLIDMHFEGDCQPVFDDLVRYLSGDQIKDFVEDFRRHHELPMGDDMDEAQQLNASDYHCSDCGDTMHKPTTDCSNDPHDETGSWWVDKDGNGVPDSLEEAPNEGNEFSGALAQAKKDGKKEFEVDGKKYKVESEEADTDTEELEEAQSQAQKDAFAKMLASKKGGKKDDEVDESEETEELEEVAVAEDDKEELEESPTMDTTQLINLMKNSGLSEEKIKTKLDEWANTPAGAAEEEATSHGEPYENFAQSVNLSLKRYLDAEDMKVGLKEHKVEDIKEAYKKSKEK